MAISDYDKRTYTNIPNEIVTYEDFNRIETGIYDNRESLKEHDNQINVLNDSKAPLDRPTFTSYRDDRGGGEILLSQPKNKDLSTLENSVRIDVYDNMLRIFEDGNGYRGAYLEFNDCAYNVGTRLATVEMITSLQEQIATLQQQLNSTQEMLVNITNSEG